MRPAIATFRLLIAASLVVSTGLSGLCRCAAIGTANLSSIRAIHRDACTCGSKTDSCCSGTACNCTGQLRQPATVQAVSDRPSDAVQLAALATNHIDIESSADVPMRLDISLARLAGFTTNLIAQGIRLNI